MIKSGFFPLIHIAHHYNSKNTHNYVKYSNVETHDPVRTFNNGIDLIKTGQGGHP